MQNNNTKWHRIKQACKVDNIKIKNAGIKFQIKKNTLYKE